MDKKEPAVDTQMPDFAGCSITEALVGSVPADTVLANAVRRILEAARSPKEEEQVAGFQNWI